MAVMDYEEKIKELGLVLPPVPEPAGSYRPAVVSGRTVYISGQIARDAAGRVLTGKAGRDLMVEEAKRAAGLAALNVLSVIRGQIGFARFDRILKVTGFVQCDPAFHEIAQVINGASDLFMAVFGDRGVHARSAVGVASLPLNSAVEVEVVIQVLPLPG